MKQNALIINLRRLGDIYATSRLVSSLKDQGYQVSMLVYKESAQATNNMANIDRVFSIDRKEIITLKNNKLFSDAMALDSLYTQVKDAYETKWSHVINFSNDKVGAYLSSYIAGNESVIIGTSFDNSLRVRTSSEWARLFNDFITTSKYSPVHATDAFIQMTGGKTTISATNGVRLSDSHNSKALKYITHIKENYGFSPGMAKVIGLQLRTSDGLKDVTTQTWIDYITQLLNGQTFIPMLLIAPTEEERVIAKDINSEFENKLIIVEADLSALASVVKNIDLLVTPDTVTKHIADSVGTPSLEISLGFAPFLKQGSCTPESLILSYEISKRCFSQSEAHEQADKIFAQNEAITAGDIYAATLFFFSSNKRNKPVLSKNISLYKVAQDNHGIRYDFISGARNDEIEIERLMTRSYFHLLLENQDDTSTYESVANISREAVSAWCSKEKNVITNLMKDLLGTLRSLVQGQEATAKKSNEFVANLGKLLQHAETKSLVSIPTMIFQSKLEGIRASSAQESAKEVESFLYELKGDIQKALVCIKGLEDADLAARKAELMNKAHESKNTDVQA